MLTDCSCQGLVVGLFIAAAVLRYVLNVIAPLRPGSEGSSTDPLREGYPQPEPLPARRTPEEEAQMDAEILRRPYQAKRVPEGLDAVVVGSGAAGLSCAAWLAKAGRKVLVLEQHDQAGGCCHTFTDKGFEFDTGIHYVGSPMDDPTRSDVRALLDVVSDGKTQWAQMAPVFDNIIIGDRQYPYEAGRDPKSGEWRFKAMMLERFPQEREGIDRFFRELELCDEAGLGLAVAKLLPLWVVNILRRVGLMGKILAQWQRRAQTVIEQCTQNKELQAVMSYSYGDYGTPPTDSPWAIHAGLVLHFLKSGAFYPVGGASRIARNIIPVIRRSGGEVLCRAKVREILVRRGRAVGVVMERDGTEIRAPLVVSDAGVGNTFTRLIPDPPRCIRAQVAALGKVRRSSGCMSVFVGLGGTAEELGLKAQNFWIFSSADLCGDLQRYLALTREEILGGDFEVPLMFLSFASAKDPTYSSRHPGKSTCEIITLATWEWFSDWETEPMGRRGADYLQVKNAIGDKIWRRALQLFPQLEERVEYFDVGTPVTNNHYLNSITGEMYGLDHDLRRFSPEVVALCRPETPIGGLYLTGQDTLTCGFSSAMVTGALTASVILRRNVILDVLRYIERRKGAKGV